MSSWGLRDSSSAVGLADPMSKCWYTITESALNRRIGNCSGERHGKISFSDPCRACNDKNGLDLPTSEQFSSSLTYRRVLYDPLPRKHKAQVAKLVDALASGASGETPWRFKSSPGHQCL